MNPTQPLAEADLLGAYLTGGAVGILIGLIVALAVASWLSRGDDTPADVEPATVRLPPFGPPLDLPRRTWDRSA